MSDRPVAGAVIVFGRGALWRDGRYELTSASRERVAAMIDYAHAHAAGGRGPGRVVLSGGWSGASNGATAPPEGSREADLMLAYARQEMTRTRFPDGVIELHTESESTSTLEGLLYTVAGGHLDGWDFTPRRPLGVVGHREHLPRISFLARKVLRLPAGAIQPIVAAGHDTRLGPVPEPVAHLAARACLLGAGTASAMHRRERRIVEAVRLIERLTGRRRPAPGPRRHPESDEPRPATRPR
jgi:hypothetical protein